MEKKSAVWKVTGERRTVQVKGCEKLTTDRNGVPTSIGVTLDKVGQGSRERETKLARRKREKR